MTIASRRRLVEPTLTKEDVGAITDVCQILDVLKADDWKDCWTEWDQGVRDRLSWLLARVSSADTGEPR